MGEHLDFVEIKLRDFASIVKRGDIKKPTWFAIDNDLLLHPDFFYITGNELKAFIWICSVASKKNNARIRVYIDLCHRQTKIPKKDIVSCIEKLKEKRWDIVSSAQTRTDVESNPNESVQIRSYTTHTTNTTDTKDEFDFDFLYQDYPRKLGKSPGLKNLKKQIKTKEDYEAFLLAVKKYKEFLRTENKAKQYTLYFSTFVGEKKEDAPWFSEWLNWEPETPPKATDPGLRIMAIEGDLDASGS